jgi:hypothetical protein
VTAATVTLGVVVGRSPAGSETTTAILLPVADAFVDGRHPARNYGAKSRLTTDASPAREVLLRFNLSPLTGAVQSARLRIHVKTPRGSASPVGGSVFRVVDTAWSEGALTYDNRPTNWGSAVAQIGAVIPNSWIEVPVTGAVATGRLVTLGVRTTSRDAAVFDSRERAAFAPRLVVTTTSSTTSPPPPPPPPPPPGSVVIAAAGDLACKPGSSVTGTQCRHLQVSNLVASDPSVQHFLALGDLQYDNGELANFQSAYASSYGRFKAKTKPAVGNHEYQTPGASGYFGYFGAAAGNPAQGYYTFDVGTHWRVVVLNSNCGIVSCAANSAQTAFLTWVLAASPRPCTIAATHHARFSSGSVHGNHSSVGPFWDALAQSGAEIALAGHEHNYERFAPQLPTGAASASGIRQFVVGTGGRGLYTFTTPRPNSQVRLGVFGVLKLTLGSGSYSWRFVGENGAVLDSGTGTCH